MAKDSYPSDCVIWPLVKDADGYGAVKKGGAYVRAHRFFYELFVGQIPAGMHVLHSCDNRACVNPSHLFIGTHADNMADRKAKLRYERGEQKSNAKLCDEDVRFIRKSTMTLRELAQKFGVCKSVVHDIKTGKTWRHVCSSV
jgi:hypothetical protein